MIDIELEKSDAVEILLSLHSRRNELYDNLIFNGEENERLNKLISAFTILVDRIGKKIESAKVKVM